jgi:hypothetical protein
MIYVNMKPLEGLRSMTIKPAGNRRPCSNSSPSKVFTIDTVFWVYIHFQCLLVVNRNIRLYYVCNKSKRSAFMTLFHAATKS